MTCTHHYSTMQSSVTALRNPLCSLIHLLHEIVLFCNRSMFLLLFPNGICTVDSLSLVVRDSLCDLTAILEVLETLFESGRN